MQEISRQSNISPRIDRIRFVRSARLAMTLRVGNTNRPIDMSYCQVLSKHTGRKLIYLLVFVFALYNCTHKETHSNPADWPEYLGGADRNHYSALEQVTLANVSRLRIAWEYHTKDSGQLQCNPIIMNGILYGMTATTEPFALDAATGRELWRLSDTTGTVWYSTSRGLAYWENGTDKRILFTRESELYALDASTGKKIESFGVDGKVSLKSGLGPKASEKFVISNTPGTVFKDLIIMPMRLSEGSDAAPGYVQAFNVKTGALAWVFKTIPHPGEEGYETWPREAYKNTNVGAVNNWAGMAVDRQREIIYIPTGSAAFDFYGGDRQGKNLFANSLLALDANTGRKIWHFQIVHHDILDRDLPAPPNLVTVNHKGKKIDAVAQTTKHGFIFLFNRETGEPLFDIEEISVPASDVAGEEAWPTQPKPVRPEPFARQTLAESDIRIDVPNRKELIAKLRSSRSEGPFTPLSEKGTIIFPGLDGGAEWGGAAADPEGILYVNSSEMPWLISLAKETQDKSRRISPGAEIYASKCSACHGSDRKGNPVSGFPSLVGINEKYNREQVLNIIAKGKGMMPAFKTFSEQQTRDLLAFLYGDTVSISEDKKEVVGSSQPKSNKEDTIQKWKISGYTKFLGSDGYPAINPPWGTLNAIDMNTGEYVWKIPYGETLTADGKTYLKTGSESYGGPLVTKSGLLFIAGTKDSKFRAYNKKNGVLVWETLLPAAAFATPATYSVAGKQYIVIACGGTKLGATKGESYLAFSLPD